MKKSYTFSFKLVSSFAILVGLSLIIAALSVYSLTKVVSSKDAVIDIDAKRAETLNSAVFRKSAGMRGYILSGKPEFRENVQANRAIFQSTYSELDKLGADQESRRVLQQVRQADADYDGDVTRLMQVRIAGAPVDAMPKP